MQTTETAASKPTSNWPQKLAIGLGVFVILGWIFRDFLWEVVQAFMINVLPIVFTPVILELTVGFAGLLVVAIFCHLRRKDQEDEWVYIEHVESEDEVELPRREAVTEPEVLGLDLGAIEELIAQGKLGEADEQLSNVDEADQRRIEYWKLRVHLLLQMEKWSEAGALVEGKSPAMADKLAVTCVDVARDFLTRKPARKDAATECLNVGKRFSVGAVMQAIDADSKLQRLA